MRRAVLARSAEVGSLAVRAFLASINHVLLQSDWAGERLRPHAGRCARVDCGPLQFPFAVAPSGSLVPAAGGHPDLILELPAAALPRLSDGWNALLGSATMRGNVEFAEAIGFVFRNLRWDVEEDLSRVTGDVAARRLVRSGAALFSALADGSRRFGENISDYLRHESGVAAPNDAVAGFCQAVDDLRDMEQRLEARLRRLESQA